MSEQKLKLESLKKEYETPYVSLYQAEYHNSESGSEKSYHFISRNAGLTADNLAEQMPLNAVAILAVDPENRKVLMTREFRMAVSRYITSIPAGLIDPGETIEEAARRELLEETGCVADEVVILPPTFSCVGLTDECVASAIVTVKGRENAHLEESEDISCAWYSYEDALKMCLDPSGRLGIRAQLLVMFWLAKEGVDIGIFDF